MVIDCRDINRCVDLNMCPIGGFYHCVLDVYTQIP